MAEKAHVNVPGPSAQILCLDRCFWARWPEMTRPKHIGRCGRCDPVKGRKPARPQKSMSRNKPVGIWTGEA